jgi:uncharacterized protein with PQ loop repeat
MYFYIKMERKSGWLQNFNMENIFGFLMSACFFSCYFPQIYLLLKNKDSNNISLVTYYITTFGYLNGIIYWIYTSSGIWILISTIINLIVCLYATWLVIKYRKNE